MHRAAVGAVSVAGTMRGVVRGGTARAPRPIAPRVLVRALSGASGDATDRGAGITTVLAPRDGKEIAAFANSTAADVDAAAAAGLEVLSSAWAAPASVGSRSEALRRLGGLLRRDRDAFAALEAADCGKPIAEAEGDMDYCADFCDFYADAAPAALAEVPHLVPDGAFTSRSVPAPAGLVAAITPWNYPLLQAMVKVAPALAAGCSVLLKPSPLASLTCVRLRELCDEAGIPAGSLSLVLGGPPGGGGAEAAARLANHPGVARMSFTGSGPTGRKLLHASADALRPSSLELGGKGAMVVFPDADLGAVADWAMTGIFPCAGQVCSATSRLIVHEDVADELTARIVEGAEGLRVGDSLARETQMGPLVSAAQRDKVLDFIERARAEGGVMVAGGGAADPVGADGSVDEDLRGGYYVQPTVIAGLGEGSEAWREEIFGPVLAVRTFKDEADAVRQANDSPYGLAHAVMSADGQRANRVAAALQAGTVWINCSQVLFPSTPFGGWKQSGFGKEYGEAALHEYVQTKTVTGCADGHAWNSYL